MRLMQYCKSSGVTVFIVGHINKEGRHRRVEGA